MRISPVSWLLLVLSVVLAGYSIFEYGKHVQKEEDTVLLENQKQICEGEIAEMVLDTQTKVDAANEIAREKEREMVNQISVLQKAHQLEKQNATKAISNINAFIYDGSLKLRVPTSFKSSSGNELQSSTGSATASTLADYESAELLPETASALVSLAGECDDVVRERNEVIEIYEAVKIQINQKIVSDQDER